MKNFTKLAVVGLTGYLIGFYECKYKVMKIVFNQMAKHNEKTMQKTSKEDSNKETEE